MDGTGISRIKHCSLLKRSARRALDLVVGSVLLCLTAPIWLLAALAVRLETKGNPFFIQTRVGLGGKPFKIVKLRGMYIDAPTRFPKLYSYRGFGNLDFHFHYKEDPRITQVGSFIRKTSIDELPNFINVVRGEMALVGPRPEVPDVLALYGEYSAPYVSVKPGITCLSKVTGRDTLTKRQTIELDLAYIRDASFRMDAIILWKTLKSVLLRQNVFHRKARGGGSAERRFGQMSE